MDYIFFFFSGWWKVSSPSDRRTLYVTSDVNVERRQLFVFCRDVSERARQHTEATYWSRSDVPSRRTQNHTHRLSNVGGIAALTFYSCLLDVLQFYYWALVAMIHVQFTLPKRSFKKTASRKKKSVPVWILWQRSCKLNRFNIARKNL